MLAYLRLQLMLFAVGYDSGANFSATFQDSHDGGFILDASSGDAALALAEKRVTA
jgi:hypothetical protein